MKPLVEPPPGREAAQQRADVEGFSREDVLRELANILASHYFQHAGRCKQFLRYVVEHKLEGQQEKLKERTIGTEVFQRPPGYATGEDPVVRVQAGEVRRRLEQYYQTAAADSPIRIELPVGSYSPVFQRQPVAAPASQSAPRRASEPALQPARRRTRPVLLFSALTLVLIVTATFTALAVHRWAFQRSKLDQFWNPVFATRQPVLICLAKPVAYRPNEDIYRLYSRAHPGTFKTEAERANTPLPLDPDTKLSWGDLFIYTDYGVAAGDVYAAAAVSTLLGKIDKPSQLRIGSNYTYADLRNSPAVVIGGFNNKWTMQLTSNLHFAFVEDNEDYSIRERIPHGRIWHTRYGPQGETLEDFGLVTRLLDSKTGQFTVTAAGIGPMGTQAAGEFISNAQNLEEGLRAAPANWQTGNMEIVVQTTVTDSVAGPPHAVAAYYW
ncbi:MAG TPA: hypothetical protein VHD85_17870 [Terracidiphilus sp.]|nr:hypothetical protein [Terracidiphilus sp.]